MRHNVDTRTMPLHPATTGSRLWQGPRTASSRVAAGVLAGLLSAAAGGCASSGAVPRPFPGAPPDRIPGPSPAGREPASATPFSGGLAGYAVAGTALGLRGAPYRNGGDDPSGFDCSGFIWFVFAQHGMDVPRTVTELFATGEPVVVDELQPGDLIFFSTVAPGATHVGMAIGGDQFVHAPSSRGEVRIERFTAPYWRTRVVGARRLIQSVAGSGSSVRRRGAHPSASTGVWSTR